MQLYIMMAILLKLIQNEKVTAPQLAQDFEVSTRSVYRYIDSLSACGVPVCTMAGRNGGIALSSQFNLSNMFFTQNELETLKQLITPNSPENLAILQKLNYIITHNYTQNV